MSLSRSLTTRFQRLRWKLTLSYTAVTVGALLTVELILLGALGIGLVAILNSGLLQAQLIEATSVDYVPTLRPYLARTPPDQPGIADWLELVATASSVTIPLTFKATDEMLVVSPNGRLLGARPPDLLGVDVIGQPLDFQAIPGLANPLRAALAGDEEVEHLYTLARPGAKVIMTVPVWDAAHEQVLGALVAMADVPTLGSFLGDALPIIGVSLLLFTFVAGLIGTLFGLMAARGPVRRLDRLASASLAWRRGDFTVLVDDASGDELGQLAQRLNHMAQQLEHLLDTRRELAAVEERNRLARDLHDSAKQQAFAAAAQISAAKTLLRQDAPAAESHVKEAERLIYDLRQELTRLIQELRPAGLEGKGLAVAVREYAADWSRQSGIQLEVRVQRERSLPLYVEQTVFRIVQEGLANVARHSEAGHAEIELVYDKHEIICTISDDGPGFDPGKKRRGLGLRSMQERANALGGWLNVTSVPGSGTHLAFAAPLSQAAESEESYPDA